ncbi:hypothetical protein ACHAXR_007512 [Thalassiosira sp. AJA248-18]
MIFWTRYTPIDESSDAEIQYRIAKVPHNNGKNLKDDAYFAWLLTRNDVRFGNVLAKAENDWAIKLDLTGLKPGTTYVYAFTDGTTTSAVGKTRTPPKDGNPLRSLKFAMFSCANYPFGYFHAYDIASTIEDLDFWYHAGDYIFIYEFHDDNCSDTRCPEPLEDAYTLEHYRQRYGSYHLDEALQNLRRSAPLISTWDDHETANDAHTTGAQNHNPGTQGSWSDRVRAAKQAYLEWMPFRMEMGPSADGLISQKFEYGDLMTFVTVDTRIPARSEEPASLEDRTAPLLRFEPAYDNVDVEAYDKAPLLPVFEAIADDLKAFQKDESYTMIGQNKVDFIAESFRQSSNSGKPWQVIGDQTMMAEFITPCLANFYSYFPTSPPELQPAVQQIMNGILSIPSVDTPESLNAFILRAACAMSITETPYGFGDWNGYSVERKKVLEVLKQNASNPIVLFGDSHDSWVQQMDLDGRLDGESIAINIGGPAVSSRGVGDQLQPLMLALKGLLDQNGFPTDLLGIDVPYLMGVISSQIEATNPTIEFSNIHNKGFVAITLTHDEAVFEHIGISQETLGTDYEDARAENSDGLTADYFCMASHITKAGQPGSLSEVSCGTTMFMNERPGYWGTTFDPEFKTKGRYGD